MKKIIVPEGMLRAACRVGMTTATDAEPILEAALRWLSENRQDMSPALLKTIKGDVSYLAINETNIYEIVNAAIKRMFLAPEPEVPEELENLIWGEWQVKHGVPEHTAGWLPIESHNAQILEAYRRGQKSKE